MAWYLVYRYDTLVGRTQSFVDARGIAVQFCNSKFKRIQIYKQSKFSKEYFSPYVVDFWAVVYTKTLDTGRKVTHLYHKEDTGEETSRMLDGSGRYYKDRTLKKRQKKNEEWFKEMGFLKR